MSVFLLPRVFECGNFHSTGISRFIVKPVPVPLQVSHLNRFFHVACSYSGIMPKSLPIRQDCSTIVVGSMLSETPGAREPLSCVANSRLACSLGQNDRQSPKLSRSRGYVSDSGHTPFTSPTPAASSSTGRLDPPYPERLIESSWIGHLFSFSIMAQSLVN